MLKCKRHIYSGRALYILSSFLYIPLKQSQRNHVNLKETMSLRRTQQIKKTSWHKSALFAVCRSNRELESLKKSTDFTTSFGRLLQEVYLSACRTCRTIIVLYSTNHNNVFWRCRYLTFTLSSPTTVACRKMIP